MIYKPDENSVRLTGSPGFRDHPDENNVRLTGSRLYLYDIRLRLPLVSNGEGQSFVLNDENRTTGGLDLFRIQGHLKNSISGADNVDIFVETFFRGR